MEKTTQLQIELHTLKLAVAYLLAQEATRLPNGLETLHEGMVAHFIDSAQAAAQGHQRQAMAVEVAMTNSIDALIALVRPLVR